MGPATLLVTLLAVIVAELGLAPTAHAECEGEYTQSLHNNYALMLVHTVRITIV